jgi:hypothetical protein
VGVEDISKGGCGTAVDMAVALVIFVHVWPVQYRSPPDPFGSSYQSASSWELLTSLGARDD